MAAKDQTLFSGVEIATIAIHRVAVYVLFQTYPLRGHSLTLTGLCRTQAFGGVHGVTSNTTKQHQHA